MGLFANERGNWLGIIVNPIGYVIDRKNIGDAATDHANAHPPSTNINPESISEEEFKVRRQQWIDSCAAALKSGDAGYSKANASQNCAARFDADPINSRVQDGLARRAQVEQSDLQIKVEQNQKNAIAILIILLAIGIALYLIIT